MAKITVLDHQTIDQIAAGEVVERPASIVKELVENAIDSGADRITVEIKDGGISMIRVTDNGSGIEKNEIRNAFLRHATSKIHSANDLTNLVSLGFRGEALASIAAVSMVEAISKVREELAGVRYLIEGGEEKEAEEIGAPEGTTIVVRNLFYNTPVRRKFLKQPQTEGSYVAELMEHLALSRPDIAFSFLINRQNKFHTSGNNDLKEVIYRIYGREIAGELTHIHVHREGFYVDGYLGKPIINRSNRNFEIFFINGRYIKSSLISKAVEEGYKEYLMQHKFPFCILHFNVDTARLDVNVHPTKMEVRIADGPAFFSMVQESIFESLHREEMIPQIVFDKDKKEKEEERKQREQAGAESGTKTKEKELPPEPFERERISRNGSEQVSIQGFDQASYFDTSYLKTVTETAVVRESVSYGEQQTLFDDRLLSEKAREYYEMIGQLFETYWLISYQNQLLIIDQHAAHEKVKFERLIRQFEQNEIVSQNLQPAIIVTLNAKEEECLRQYRDYFMQLGFEAEEFGGNEYALCSVPADLYGFGEAEYFREMIDELTQAGNLGNTPDAIRSKIASMACKAAVKGNMRLSRAEAEALIDELLTLENPYHCPHGRPVIVSMSKTELERKFKRIVN